MGFVGWALPTTMESEGYSWRAVRWIFHHVVCCVAEGVVIVDCCADVATPQAAWG